jgi:hypothetical protein
VIADEFVYAWLVMEHGKKERKKKGSAGAVALLFLVSCFKLPQVAILD